MNNIILNNNFEIPQIGIGTYKVNTQKEMDNLINYSFNSGYRFIDTASYYNNENLIGNTFLNNRDLKNKFKICTKIWPSDFDEDKTKYSIERSLNSMNLDKIDIMFLHWPSDGFLKSWKVLENYYEQGVFNAIAVCNFHKNHLNKLLANANIKPVINQIELHPYLTQKDLTDFCKNLDIKIQAWSPLGRADTNLFKEKILLNLSNKYNKTVPQIILKWHIQNGEIIIPKSTNEKRIDENINIFDFTLNSEELKTISSLNKNYRYSQNPDDENWLEKIRKG